MEIRFKGMAKRLYFASDKRNEKPLVDVWLHLEAIRMKTKPCPCPIGKVTHDFVVCANAEIFVIHFERPNVNLLIVKKIEKVE